MVLPSRATIVQLTDAAQETAGDAKSAAMESLESGDVNGALTKMTVCIEHNASAMNYATRASVCATALRCCFGTIRTVAQTRPCAERTWQVCEAQEAKRCGPRLQCSHRSQPRFGKSIQVAWPRLCSVTPFFPALHTKLTRDSFTE
jgi:hypothetical protein